MINIVNIPYLGDLYRLYVDEAGEIIEIRIYEEMATAYRLCEFDNLPTEVQRFIENNH